MRDIQIFSFTTQIRVLVYHNISIRSIIPKLMRTRHRHRYTLLKHSSLVPIFLTQTALFRLPWLPAWLCAVCTDTSLNLRSPAPGLAGSLTAFLLCRQKLEMSSSSIKIGFDSPTLGLASIWF